mmetsp:Transcript_3879/g.14308  ORF Transcript_3879/g.14308 Transcript_3879/m.14308 type:complete len:214 (-) Transcript_3879:3997-4638(-)
MNRETAALVSGGRACECATHRNIQFFSWILPPPRELVDASPARSVFETSRATVSTLPGENEVISTPKGPSVAATPSPLAPRIANNATRDLLFDSLEAPLVVTAVSPSPPTSGNLSTRIHAANVYPARPAGQLGGCVTTMHPGPDSAWIRVEWVEKGFREEKVAPETSAALDPPKSKYAAGPSRFAASRSPVKSWRLNLVSMASSRNTRNAPRK